MPCTTDAPLASLTFMNTKGEGVARDIPALSEGGRAELMSGRSARASRNSVEPMRPSVHGSYQCRGEMPDP